jgi:dihydrofolate reductase
MSRPRLSVFMAMSLDGYIARPDGSLGWLEPFEKSGEDYGYPAFFESVDALVIGRNTYETVLGFPAWPYGQKRVVVLTHRPAAALHGEEFSNEQPVALAKRLGREGAQHLYVDGGVVARSFLRARLVDDLALSIIPVVLGAGIRLFGESEPEQALVLEGSRSWPSGLVQVRYRVR